MATGSPNPNNVSMNAKFYDAPTSDAEKTAQNNFLSAISNGVYIALPIQEPYGTFCGFRGGLTQNGYSDDLGQGIIITPADFPCKLNITKDGNIVGEINFVLNSSLTQFSNEYKIYGGTITHATYAAPTQKDVLTANTDLYNSSGTLIVANGGTIDVGSMDLGSLRLKTTIPAMNDANGDGIDDSNPGTISGAKAYELIESSLPSGFTKSTSGGQVTYTFAETASSGGSSGTSGSSGFQGGSGSDELVLYLQVGAEAGQHINVGLERMNSTVIGVNGIDVTSQDSAGSAIDTVKAAIEKISGMRSKYGACQNRLEHTIKNLDNIVENTSSAESKIRDTDMAESMVEFSKLQILRQVGQSVLAQANQNNSSVLSLLQ